MKNKKTGFFKYTCHFYDDMENKMKIAKGIICAKTYAEAMAAAELYYDIEDIFLEWEEEGIVYQFHVQDADIDNE